MAIDDSTRADIQSAIDAALAGKWDDAHAIAQRHEGDAIADWLHAVLHKIEGDETNSRYWYRRSGLTRYEHYSDPPAELRAIIDTLARET